MSTYLVTQVPSGANWGSGTWQNPVQESKYYIVTQDKDTMEWKTDLKQPGQQGTDLNHDSIPKYVKEWVEQQDKQYEIDQEALSKNPPAGVPSIPGIPAQESPPEKTDDSKKRKFDQISSSPDIQLGSEIPAETNTSVEPESKIRKTSEKPQPSSTPPSPLYPNVQDILEVVAQAQTPAEPTVPTFSKYFTRIKVIETRDGSSQLVYKIGRLNPNTGDTPLRLESLTEEEREEVLRNEAEIEANEMKITS